MKSYQATIDWLYTQTPAFQKIGGVALKVDLRNIKALMQHLEHPQRHFPSIHIAGTNGKGSCTHIIAAVLQACGLKVGAYTSPHYIDFRERIKINGTYIPEAYVVDFVHQVRKAILDIQPSFFEITVAMAFQYFSDEQVDIAVIETGLGGRLDSTNIIQPEISLITNISFDHQQFLGNTLPKIAQEKAGIIKPKTPVIIGERHPETVAVFLAKAKKEQAPIFFAQDDWIVERKANTGNQAVFDIYHQGALFLKDQGFGLTGGYQRKNLVSSLATIHQIKDHWGITKLHIQKGLENIVSLTRVMGRWQTIQENPRVIIDSGHNPKGVQLVFEQLESMPKNRLLVVFGMLKDRKLEDFLPYLPQNAQFFICQPAIHRAKPVAELEKAFKQAGLNYSVHPSVKEAYHKAIQSADNEDILFIGGSSFIVADALSFLQ
ncbi:MAG: folylpolyglutamate synthase/dihydrofolate synthase family protein [Bacteroidota bacterium]